MTIIDWILLLTVLTVTWYNVIVPTGKWLRHLLGLVCVLIVTQILISGFLWHFVPAYLLVALLALSLLKFSAKKSKLRTWATRLLLLFVMFLAILPFAVFTPLPVIPTPSGVYSIGTKIYRWVDSSREEQATENKSDKRNVIAQVWYPTQFPRQQKSVYMDGLTNLPLQFGLLSDFVMRKYDQINTHATLNAAISNQKLWPVVIFSPGFGSSRSWQTGLITEMVSRGYVVFALDHPYETTITELANGTIVRRIDTSPRDNDARGGWMAAQLSVRATDFKFVLDRVFEGLDGLKNHLDTSHIVAIGHSFGGATAVVATAQDPRIKAAVNIDGTLYGEIPHLTRPFLWVQSDSSVTLHSDFSIARNIKLLEQTTAPAWRYEMLGANHLVFMDNFLSLAAPAKWILKKTYGGNLFGGDRKPTESQHTSIDIIDAFIRETLLAEKDVLTLTVAQKMGIRGRIHDVSKTVSPIIK